MPTNGRTLRGEVIVVPEINFSLQHLTLSQRGKWTNNFYNSRYEVIPHTSPTACLKSKTFCNRFSSEADYNVIGQTQGMGKQKQSQMYADEYKNFSSVWDNEIHASLLEHRVKRR